MTFSLEKIYTEQYYNWISIMFITFMYTPFNRPNFQSHPAPSPTPSPIH